MNFQMVNSWRKKQESMKKSKYSVEQVEKILYANNVETQIFDRAFIQAWNGTRAELE